MVEIMARRHESSFFPVDDDGLTALMKLKQNSVVKIKFTLARNYENHKRFFAFVNTTFDMQEHFTEILNYRKWLTMKCGYYTTIVTPKNDTIFIADSINFDSMDEDEFQKLFSSAIDVFIRELGKGISEDEFMDVLRFS